MARHRPVSDENSRRVRAADDDGRIFEPFYRVMEARRCNVSRLSTLNRSGYELGTTKRGKLMLLLASIGSGTTMGRTSCPLRRCGCRLL